jgi:hypothetical protein
VPPIRDLPTLLRKLDPILQPGVFAFATLAAGEAPDPGAMLAAVREPEGWSVLRAVDAPASPTSAALFRWITLSVPSDLNAVGLTAAVAQALADAGIACNVIAGHHHDHLLVPAAAAAKAMAVLQALQAGGSP